MSQADTMKQKGIVCCSKYFAAASLIIYFDIPAATV